jgi:hypothetical protein
MIFGLRFAIGPSFTHQARDITNEQTNEGKSTSRVVVCLLFVLSRELCAFLVD